MQTKKLIQCYPRLYHMAEKDSWASIKSLGLLSTSAALDLVGLAGRHRAALEREHRPEKVSIGSGSKQIILRDQKPMAPERLTIALKDGLTPTQWYQLLNGKVFMWAQKERLIRLLKARPYRKLEHDVLVIDSSSLLNVHEKAIWLCHMNSGNTFPIPGYRGKKTFMRIADYPCKLNGNPQKEVVEVVVDHCIPDIAKHVIAVKRMRGEKIISSVAI